MKIVSMICQKGGTAKTTAAINLAVEARAHGLETVVIDLDPQGSACKWRDIRGNSDPLVAGIVVSQVPKTLQALRENGADLVIIDTAGRSNDVASAAAQAADLVLVAMQASLMDLQTLQSTLDVIRAGGTSPLIRVLLTRVKSAGSRHQDSAGWLTGRKMDICPVMLGERVTYQDAYTAGQGVTEFEPAGKAAAEIRELYAYVNTILTKTDEWSDHVQEEQSRQRAV